MSVNAALSMRRAASAVRPDAVSGRDHSVDIYASTSVDARFRDPENVSTIQKSRIDATIARVLRIALSSPQPIAHRTLRAKALQGDENTNASKAAVDLALLTLVDHQFLVRHGNGNFASYTVRTSNYVLLCTALVFNMQHHGPAGSHGFIQCSTGNCILGVFEV